MGKHKKVGTFSSRIWPIRTIFGHGIYAVFLSLAFHLEAQDTAVSQTWSSVKYNINSAGGLGTENAKAIEFPMGSNKFPLRRLNFWLTGLKSNGDTIAVAADIFSTAGNWTEGPLGTATPAHLNRKQWLPFYSVSSPEIETHRVSWMNGSYSAPVSIAKWPGLLNANGFPKVCAPYVDFDQNGEYLASAGDYPYLPGRYNVFTMASDSAKRAPLKKIQTGLDMSALWFDPLKNDSIANTSYFRLTVCNRYNDTITNLKISAVADFAIGNTIDDQLATHVGYHAIYAYNQPGGDAVYGNNWPAVAVGWHSIPASASIYMMPDNGSVQGNPQSEREFYNYANGLWRSGKNMGSTGSGLDASSSFSRFIYPGTTDTSLGKNRNWTNKEGNAGRQTALISTAGFTFNGKGCKVVDGFVTVVADAPDSARMEKRFAAIRNHYNKQDYTLKAPLFSFAQTGTFYPNPAGSNEEIRIPGGAGKMLVISDITGKIVLEQKLKSENVPLEIKQGVYLIRINGISAGLLQVR